MVDGAVEGVGADFEFVAIGGGEVWDGEDEGVRIFGGDGDVFDLEVAFVDVGGAVVFGAFEGPCFE